MGANCMLVNQTWDWEKKDLPRPDAKHERVYWKNRVFPFDVYCLIHEISVRLLALIKICPEASDKVREQIAAYLSTRSSFLLRSLPGISEEALMDAMEASIAIHHYLRFGEKMDWLSAQKHLKQLHRRLRFNAFFEQERDFCEKSFEKKTSEAEFQMIGGELRVCG